MTPSLPRRALLTLAATATVAGVVATATACGAQGTSAGAGHTSAAHKRTEVTTISNEKMTVPADKPTALFFFSVGCGECAGGVKSLTTAGAALHGKANLLAVDMDPSESPQTIRQFLDSIKAPDLPAIIDKGAALSRAYKVAALSTLIVIDPAGTVTYRATDPGPGKIQTALNKAGTR
jgi:hypothetical protein